MDVDSIFKVKFEKLSHSESSHLTRCRRPSSPRVHENVTSPTRPSQSRPNDSSRKFRCPHLHHQTLLFQNLRHLPGLQWKTRTTKKTRRGTAWKTKSLKFPRKMKTDGSSEVD